VTAENEAMDLRLPGIILTVTGIVATAITLTTGPNLGMSSRTGLAAGVVLLALGLALLLVVGVTGRP